MTEASKKMEGKKIAAPEHDGNMEDRNVGYQALDETTNSLNTFFCPTFFCPPSSLIPDCLACQLPDGDFRVWCFDGADD